MAVFMCCQLFSISNLFFLLLASVSVIHAKAASAEEEQGDKAAGHGDVLHQHQLALHVGAAMENQP